MLDPQCHRQAKAQYRRGVGKNSPHELLLRCFIHYRIPELWTNLNRAREFRSVSFQEMHTRPLLAREAGDYGSDHR